MNPQLNKKVKKYLDSYFRDTKTNSPEHQEAVMLILRGALTDANFHSEAKQLGKYFPKASKKYIGTPMEGVIEDKGVDIAKMAKWDGHDIIDAFAFYLSMSIGGSFGNRLMSLKESLEESLVIEGERLDEKNCPTDASKWSYYKSQAKKKFDVYPSAYANGWASKQYKAAGGGWKSCKKESVDEGMVTPRRGHSYYQLTKDTPIKYVSGRSGIGLEVPGVLLHNEYDTIKGKKGAYIIDYFGQHFYVDLKNKFASRIAHPENREQNKDLMKNVKRVFEAPEHNDWKKYVRESVNELNVKTYRSAFQKAMDRGDDKGREIARRAIDLLGREIAKELKNTSLVVKPSDIKSFHSKYFGGKPPMTGQYEIKFNGTGTLHKPDLNLDTKDITLFVKGEVGQAKEYGGWDGPIELDRYIGWKPVTLQLSIRNGSVEVYPYGGGGQLQFSRQGARLLAAYAKSMNIAMGGDGKVKHNNIKQFTPHKNESVNEAKYNYKDDAMTAYMKGKISAQELDKIAKNDFKSSVATKKELQNFLDSGYMKSLMANTYGLKVSAMEKKVKELMRFAESVNEASVSDFEIGDFVHFKSKNKSGMVVSVKGNKVTINTPKGKITSDVKDVKVLHQDNVNEAASRTAMEIGGLTGLNKDAIQKFVDDNKLDIEKVYQFVKKGKLADRMKLVSAIAGKPNNPVQKKIIKQFGESVNEAKSITLITFGGRKTKYKNSDIDGFIRDLDLSAEDLPGLLYKASMKNSGLIGTRNKSFKKKKEAILKLLKRIKSHNGDVIIDVDSKKSPMQHSVVFESVNETLIKEAKVRLGKDSVNFKVMGDSKGLTLIAASGNDLDGLQDAIENDVDVKEELRKTLEKQLKVPVEVDRGYDGAGFRFNIDFYSLAKKVK